MKDFLSLGDAVAVAVAAVGRGGEKPPRVEGRLMPAEGFLGWGAEIKTGALYKGGKWGGGGRWWASSTLGKRIKTLTVPSRTHTSYAMHMSRDLISPDPPGSVLLYTYLLGAFENSLGHQQHRG